jgi:hypothetical protein
MADTTWSTETASSLNTFWNVYFSRVFCPNRSRHNNMVTQTTRNKRSKPSRGNDGNKQFALTVESENKNRSQHVLAQSFHDANKTGLKSRNYEIILSFLRSNQSWSATSEMLLCSITQTKGMYLFEGIVCFACWCESDKIDD